MNEPINVYVFIWPCKDGRFAILHVRQDGNKFTGLTVFPDPFPVHYLAECIESHIDMGLIQVADQNRPGLIGFVLPDTTEYERIRAFEEVLRYAGQPASAGSKRV